MKRRGIYIHTDCLVAMLAPHDFHPMGTPKMCERCRAHRIEASVRLSRLSAEDEAL